MSKRSEKDWEEYKIRKGNKEGIVTDDSNPGRYRILTVRFEDGTREQIWLNNIGQDSESAHEFEWWLEQTKEWVKF